MNAAGINALGTFSVGHDTFSLYRLDIGLATETDAALALSAGVFRTGNPRVWIVDSRQRYVHVDGRTRVIHLE